MVRSTRSAEKSGRAKKKAVSQSFPYIRINTASERPDTSPDRANEAYDRQN